MLHIDQIIPPFASGCVEDGPVLSNIHVFTSHLPGTPCTHRKVGSNRTLDALPQQGSFPDVETYAPEPYETSVSHLSPPLAQANLGEQSSSGERWCNALAAVIGVATITITIYYGWKMLQYQIWTSQKDFRDSCITDRDTLNLSLSEACKAALMQKTLNPPSVRVTRRYVDSMMPRLFATRMQSTLLAFMVALAVTITTALGIVTVMVFRPKKGLFKPVASLTDLLEQGIDILINSLPDPLRISSSMAVHVSTGRVPRYKVNACLALSQTKALNRTSQSAKDWTLTDRHYALCYLTKMTEEISSIRKVELKLVENIELLNKICTATRNIPDKKYRWYTLCARLRCRQLWACVALRYTTQQIQDLTYEYEIFKVSLEKSGRFNAAELKDTETVSATALSEAYVDAEAQIDRALLHLGSHCLPVLRRKSAISVRCEHCGIINTPFLGIYITTHDVDTNIRLCDWCARPCTQELVLESRTLDTAHILNRFGHPLAVSSTTVNRPTSILTSNQQQLPQQQCPRCHARHWPQIVDVCVASGQPQEPLYHPCLVCQRPNTETPVYPRFVFDRTLDSPHVFPPVVARVSNKHRAITKKEAHSMFRLTPLKLEEYLEFRHERWAVAPPCWLSKFLRYDVRDDEGEEWMCTMVEQI